jgi:hypothetical protein
MKGQIALWPPVQPRRGRRERLATAIHRPVPQDDFQNAFLFSRFQNRNRSRMFPRRSQRNFKDDHLAPLSC